MLYASWSKENSLIAKISFKEQIIQPLTNLSAGLSPKIKTEPFSGKYREDVLKLGKRKCTTQID